MAENEPYSLTWKNHNEYFLSVANNFYDDKFLTDIDLICQGNQKIGCHRLVLASYSNFFQRLFTTQLPTERSYAMVTIQYEDMKVLVEYMYTGEMRILKDDLPRIEKLAEFFEIKGFAETLREYRQSLVTQNGEHETSPKSENEGR